jgi:SAM-dependent methyltransferase
MKNHDEFSYTGTDNLEVMAEAENYNAYLMNLVTRHLAGARRIVDFGAGIGTFSHQLHVDGRQVIAVEPDAGQRRKIQELGISCEADASQVPDGWADAIFTMNVLEHIEDDRAALDLLHRKLKPGGRLLIYVPAFQVLYSAMDSKVGHYRRYGRDDLVAKARAAGFRVESARYADSLGFLASLVYKWFGDKSGNVDRRALRTYDRFVFPVSRMLDSVLGPLFGKNLVLVAST